jgi:hypothetical protein
MAYIDGLPEKEREALEQGFREHLAGTVPAMIAKRFSGGETWCADPIIRREALAYLKAMRPDFSTTLSELYTHPSASNFRVVA